MQRQLFEYHPAFGYRFIPGVKARVDHEGGGYLLRANGSGFRCRHEFVPEKSPGTFRVLLFGDSYTAGDGVSEKDRYGDVLETLIPGLEVFNFGLSGTGTDQHYLVYHELAAGLEHDLVLIGVLVENIRRVAARYRPFQDEKGERYLRAKPYFSRSPDGGLDLHHVPVPREMRRDEDLEGAERELVDEGGRFAPLRVLVNRMGPRAKVLMQRLTRYQPLPEYTRSDHPDWLLMKAILTHWARESKTPVLVCPIPLYQYVEDTASAAGYQARFHELEGSEGITVHDPLPDFLAYGPEERRGFRFHLDCHLTPSAHRVLAESIAPRVRAFMGR